MRVHKSVDGIGTCSVQIVGQRLDAAEAVEYSAMCRAVECELHVVLDVGDGVGAMTAAAAMRSPLYSVCAAG